MHRSENLEKTLQQEQQNAFRALEDLEELSAVTEKSFQLFEPPVLSISQPPEPAPVSSPVAEPAPKLNPIPKPQIQFSDRHQNNSALKDDSVLNALLDYHTLRTPTRGATTTPKPAATSSRVTQKKSNAPLAPQFSPAEIPIVDEIERKEPLKKSLRSAHPTASVLRSKPPRS